MGPAIDIHWCFFFLQKKKPTDFGLVAKSMFGATGLGINATPVRNRAT